MRFTAFTVFFVALFALFSTLAYAAPVAPQGAIAKRQCGGGACRNASTNPPGSGSTDRFAVVVDIINQLLAAMGGSNNTPNTPQSTAVTTSQTSTASTSNPTGV